MGASSVRHDAGPERSVDPCPVCGRHELALEQPPHIPVAGAQPYTELYRMGDLPMPVGVRCRSCGTAWPTIAALSAGEPGSAEAIEPVDGLDGPDAGPVGKAPSESSAGPVVATMAAIGAAIALAVAGLLELAFILVGAAVLAVRALGGRRRRS
jgi:hypothetical protein